MAEPAKAPDGEVLSEVERTIRRYGGVGAAVAGLLAANDALRAELAATSLAVSFGYSRGWHRRRGRSDG